MTEPDRPKLWIPFTDGYPCIPVTSNKTANYLSSHFPVVEYIPQSELDAANATIGTLRKELEEARAETEIQRLMQDSIYNARLDLQCRDEVWLELLRR